ncbi:MAG: tetratricopeptide repeat protein [Methylococcaceae bacterium]|nr:tetratricopeptide repeat protein [Methylococcaceae bacterium]
MKIKPVDWLVGSFWIAQGRWLANKGMASLAETCYRNGAAGDGKTAAEASFLLSQQLLAKNQNLEAVKACEQAIIRDPKHAKAWCALGAARRRLAQMEAAKDAYEKAVSLAPDYAQAWSNLGEWWLVKGDYSTALAQFEQALRLDPHLLEALNNSVAALYELARFDDAETAARKAIELYPNQAALHVNLGNVLLHTGKSRLAVESFRKSLECDPTCPGAQIGLATLLGESHRLAEALAFFQDEIAVKGENAQRLASLALAQRAQCDWHAAEATCDKVLEMQANNVSALITLASCLSTRADHRGAIRLHQRALAENPQMPGIRSSIAFDATYLPELSSEALFGYHQEWADHFETVDGQQAFSHDPRRQTDEPLRIGYVSGDFGTHPVGFLLKDIVRCHDHRQYYIHCYSMMRSSDDITNAIRESADMWTDALFMCDEELAEQIYRDRIDILVDLSGHTAYNRLPVFVRRPVPVQATWIGYFHSTGLKSIDYFITDPYTTPLGCGQLFSEIPVRLPHSRFCYSPPDYAPEVAPPPIATQGRITFGSFNRIEKLVDPVIAAWTEIIQAVPNSRLLLKSGPLKNQGVCDDLRRRFVACGLDETRLELRGPSPHREMLQEYGEVDIALDPFPFNGGMTTLEALWMGVPVVTVAGGGVVSRQTLSALENMGLTDLVFPDVASYIRGAVELAGDGRRLGNLRKELRPRMDNSPLRRPEQFTRDLESLYRKMWLAWQRGEKLTE